MTIKTHFRTCNLCEAMCGLKIEHENKQVISIKGDEKDPFSQGHICPKAVALQDLYTDPDRLKKPMERTERGWREITWQDALDKAAAGIQQVQSKYGNNALGVYLGNPNVHNLGGMLTIKYILNALKTRNRFSATSVDQLPHHIVSYHLFGHQLRIPVPDINRTEHIVIFGANPVVSNGSIMTVAGAKQKIKDIKGRGGKVVVIDPRRSETASIATDHHFIKPGTDVTVLLAMVRELFVQGLVRESNALSLVDGYEVIQDYVSEFTPEFAEAHSGMSAHVIRTIISEFAKSPKAVMYGRMGVSVQEFGLLSQYLIMLINILTGRLDEVGGLMFSNPAANVVDHSGPGYFDKRRSRVRNLPDFNGEFPASTLADEILTEGDGQIKAMFTVAGNPVLSTPNGDKLDQALEGIDFMVCIDYYLNETTRHANIILPPVSPLERDHYDVSFHNLAVHNTAKYSHALFKKSPNERHDWQIYLELANRLNPAKRFSDKAMRLAIKYFSPTVLLNAMLKRGPHKDVSLKTLKKAPHGIDLGPLRSHLPDALKTKDKRIHLNLEFYFKDIQRLKAKFADAQTTDADIDGALLIGRRDLRTNNSWLHNTQRMVKGKNRCTLMIHPDHAERLNITNGDKVLVQSRVNQVTIEAQISDEVMDGVVSIPHGWGHHKMGMNLTIASAHAGVSVNDLTDDTFLDDLSGNAAVNGVPVTLCVVANHEVDEKDNQIGQKRHSALSA